MKSIIRQLKKTTSKNQFDSSKVKFGILIFLIFIVATPIHAQQNTAPEIHGADVYGARPNHPFLYKIPATGAIPIIYQVLNLPIGLSVDKNTGIITGTTPEKGIYVTQFIAQNEFGADTLNFEIRSGDAIAITPAMGWNSWNVFGLRVTDQDIRNAADIMVSSGLINHGWTYINIDDGWESAERLANGEITGNEKFPDMVALSDYIHSKGLKFGIYTSPGPKTCGGYLGSYEHEEQDIKTFEKWNVDYLKYDWCSYMKPKVGGFSDLFREKKSRAPYQKMSPFILNANRDMVYSICQYGFGNVEKWGKEVGGNSWRTTLDIVDTWRSVNKILNKQKKLAPFASLGHYNDPDMLVLGVVGWNKDSRTCRLTEAEQRLHFSMWSMFASPLLLGCDLTKIDSFTMHLITNDEIIALNQDRLGKQAVLVQQKNKIQIWKKELYDQSIAIAVVNLNKKDKNYDLSIEAVTNENFASIVDVWTKESLTLNQNKLELSVHSHGVVVLRLDQ
jgi:alpha-galactosidase